MNGSQRQLAVDQRDGQGAKIECHGMEQSVNTGHSSCSPLFVKTCAVGKEKALREQGQFILRCKKEDQTLRGRLTKGQDHRCNAGADLGKALGRKITPQSAPAGAVALGPMPGT